MAFYLKKNVDWLPRLHFHYFKRKIRWNFCWVKKIYKNELNKKFNVSNVYACMKSLNTVFPHIVSSLEQFPHIYVLWPLALCTVTFGFSNSKKNSFRGNYMRKYGSHLFIFVSSKHFGVFADLGRHIHQIGMHLVCQRISST